jgi:hypothetical protein
VALGQLKLQGGMADRKAELRIVVVYVPRWYAVVTCHRLAGGKAERHLHARR